eukprot:363841-Chlamydomonas_euryale.AAC.8
MPRGLTQPGTGRGAPKPFLGATRNVPLHSGGVDARASRHALGLSGRAPSTATEAAAAQR